MPHCPSPCPRCRTPPARPRSSAPPLLLGVAVWQSSVILAKGSDITPATYGWLALRSGLPLLGLGAVCWYFIRWQDRWFRKHAESEFRLKKQAFDVERAGWVYEMGLAWKKEALSDMPAELVSRLTQNLFHDHAQLDPVATPADQLASAILGSSASAKITTPVGEVTLDRKGLNRLGKES